MNHEVGVSLTMLNIPRILGCLINLLHPEFIWPQKLIFFVRSAEEGIVFCMIQVRFHIVHNRCSLKKKKKKKIHLVT